MFAFLRDLFPPDSRWRQTFQSLRNPNYRTYALGQLVSNAGTWMQSVALSWTIYKLTGSPLALGLVQFASNLPLLLFLWVGGMVADRFDRRKVLIITQWLDMTQAILITVLYFTGHLTVPWLIVLAIFLGLNTAIETPCRQSFVPSLVERDELTNAIGINSALVNVSKLIGPMLAGLAIALGGEGLCFVLNALSYIAAIYSLHRITVRPAVNLPDATDHHGQGEIVPHEEQPQTLWAWLKQPKVRNVFLLVGATGLFGMQFSVLLPVISAQNLSDSTGALVAMLSASMGVGALIGALLIATNGTANWLRPRVGIAAFCLACGIGLLALSHTLILSMMAMAVCGFCSGILLSGSNTFIQLQVPPALRGRAMSLFSTTLMGLTPFAALVAGSAAEAFGLALSLGVSATVLALASVVYLRQVFKS